MKDEVFLVCVEGIALCGVFLIRVDEIDGKFWDCDSVAEFNVDTIDERKDAMGDFIFFVIVGDFCDIGGGLYAKVDVLVGVDGWENGEV